MLNGIALPDTTKPLVLEGNVIDMLKLLPRRSVQCAVTSPPYFGLRSYKAPDVVWDDGPTCKHEWSATPPRRPRKADDAGVNSIQQAHVGASYEARDGNSCSKCNAWWGQLGSEPTPQLYVQHIVQVCREVKHVLRDDGVFWLNIADSYNSNNGFSRANSQWKRPGRDGGTNDKRATSALPTKSLFGIPWRVAFALQDDGWILRSDIIWHKPAPMPETMKDRPTRSHEYIFMLVKNDRYYYDYYAERIPNPRADERGTVFGGRGDGHKAETTRNDHGNTVTPNPAGSNLKTVWTISNRSEFKGKHFATFPTALPGRCIKLSTSDGGACPECAAPYERVVEKGAALREWQLACGADVNGEYHGNATKEYEGTGAQTPGEVKAGILAGLVEKITRGWIPTCGHPKSHDGISPVPCLVLDPFAGSGTTLLMAHRLGRRSVGIELSPDYVKQISARLAPELNLSDGF
jgi:DNA modification methylase